MESIIKVYQKSISSKQMPNGTIVTTEKYKYFPDENTEISHGSFDNEYHYLTDKELNEIMEELESPKTIVNDEYPLKNIRKFIFE